LPYIALGITFLLLVALLRTLKAKRESSRFQFSRHSSQFLIFVAAMWLATVIGIVSARNALDLWEIVRIALYFALPALFAVRSRTFKELHSLGWDDLIPVALLFIPIDMRLVPTWITYESITVAPLIFAVCIYLVVLYRNILKLDFDFRWQLTRQNASTIRNTFFVLVVAIPPIALTIGFAHMGLRKDVTLMHVFSIVSIYFLTVALPEELVFRGILQTILTKRHGNLLGILVTAVLFGLIHLNNESRTSVATFGVPNWWYMVFAIFAGIGYGYVYQKTKNLFAPVTLHATVDLVWYFFLRG